MTVLALVWPSSKTVSVVNYFDSLRSQIFSSQFIAGIQPPKKDTLKMFTFTFPPSGLWSLSPFPLSLSVLSSHQGSSNKITPWEVSYSYSNPSIYLPLFSSYLAIINPPLSQDDSLLSCPGVHLTKDPGYRSYPSR